MENDTIFIKNSYKKYQKEPILCEKGLIFLNDTRKIKIRCAEG